jgi:tRNA-dihydrouridine synthase B
MTLRRPFSLGKLQLSSNIFCAPLAGCSDYPFRQMTSRYLPGLIFCEMVKIEALTHKNAKTCRYLDYSPNMRPIGAQICGSKPLVAAAAAKIVEDLGFDCLDLNCGCPVDKVIKDGSGSGLLRNPERIGEIVSAIVAAVRIPVTIKIRSGWNDQEINAVQVTTLAEQAGAVAITVHGRTRAQGYRGSADWEIIRECKRAAKTIHVIGNGDVVDGDSAARMFDQTGCDGVLIARGTLGQPWVIEDIERHLLGLPPIHRTIEDVRTALLDHFQKITRYQPARQAVLDMRRVGCWYLKRCLGAKALRMQINQASSLEEVFLLLDSYDWSSLSLHHKPQCAETEGYTPSSSIVPIGINSKPL